MERLIGHSVEPTTVEFMTPRFFGSEGESPQETLITDEPLRLNVEEYERLREIAGDVVRVIDSFELSRGGKSIGVDPETLKECIRLDSCGKSQMRYGGLDLYQTEDGDFRVLEINPRVQAMGLQDFRQEVLGIVGQPQLLQHFLGWVKDRGFTDVVVLGSRKNPFWRGYQRVVERMVAEGINASFWDADTFIRQCRDFGFVPSLILKFCNNNIFLRSEYSSDLKGIIISNRVQIVNSLSSVYFGYRGFMYHLGNECPSLVPSQIALGESSLEEWVLEDYPWVKLEASGKAYVVNYSNLRRWGRDTLLYLINGDLPRARSILSEKTSGDARKLLEVVSFLEDTPRDQIVWLAQSNVEPSRRVLAVGGQPTNLMILYRLYWFKDDDNNIQISLEAFGCTEEQFKMSKGKINAGTGIAIPVVVE